MLHAKYRVLSCKANELEGKLNEASEEGWEVVQLTPCTFQGNTHSTINGEASEFGISYSVVMIQAPPMRKEIWNTLCILASERIRSEELGSMLGEIKDQVASLRGKINESK